LNGGVGQPPRADDARLVVRDGEGARHIVPLDAAQDALWIGRGSARDIALDWDPEVSVMHAQLERSGDDWALVDDGISRNGSYVNGERLRGRRRLRDRDVLRFGSTVAQFRAGGEAEVRATAGTADALEAVALSPAQRRVLVALCRPFKDSAAFAAPPSNPEIAEELYVTVEAVKTHLRALFVKFGVDDLAQNRKRLALVEQALQRGVISDADL
jgi:hypothetical protein